MANINTTVEQDKAIEAAESNDHISNLTDVIDSLDEQISSWRNASGCDSPEELKESIEELKERIEELQERIESKL